MFSKYKTSRMWFSIWFSFVYVMTYACGLILNISPNFIYALLLGSPFILVWLVISILKDKHEPQKTFDEYFYQDEDLRRAR